MNKTSVLLILKTTLIVLITISFYNNAKGQNLISVTDSTGRTLTLNKTPGNIACLYAFCGHVVAMLDRGSDIVAVVNGLKKDRLLHQLVPDIINMPVPAKGGIINIEALLKTKPDIIFLKSETAAIKAEISKLKRFNLPYFVAGYHNMQEQRTTIKMIGKIIGQHEKALFYTKYYKNIIKMVKSRTKQIPADKKIRLFHSVLEPNRTDAAGTLEADWTKACGVINVSADSSIAKKGNKQFVDMEQILLWNPEVIIVNEEGLDKHILTNKKWFPIKAVKNKKVYAIPLGISRWGHPGGLETPLAVIWTAKKVYPELFLDVDLKKEIYMFYKTFFNLLLDKKTLENILNNKGMRGDRS